MKFRLRRLKTGKAAKSLVVLLGRLSVFRGFYGAVCFQLR